MASTSFARAQSTPLSAAPPTLFHPQPQHGRFPLPYSLAGPSTLPVPPPQLVPPQRSTTGLMPQDLNTTGAAMLNGPMPSSYGAKPDRQEMFDAVEKLKFFLATAPGSFDKSPAGADDTVEDEEERCLNRFLLPTGEMVSCVLWHNLYHITGTDIVRALTFRFQAFGRPVKNVKKFEEGIFSDLRNLKSGTDATLEEPKSEFLEFLFKYNCIRTQKKQKIFYWFSVPHDRLFLDALDRDLKREKLGQAATTTAEDEPALSFVYNPQQSLYEQFIASGSSTARAVGPSGPVAPKKSSQRTPSSVDGDSAHGSEAAATANSPMQPPLSAAAALGVFSLFEGSPTYKQRRKVTPKPSKSRRGRDVDDEDTRSPVVPLSAPPRYDGDRSGYSHHGGHTPMTAAPRRTVSQPTRHYAPYAYTPSPLQYAPQLAPVKTFTCPLVSCGRTFKRLEHLKRHVRTHSAEQSHDCDRCDKRFDRPEHLEDHARLHERMEVEGRSPAAENALAAEETGQLHGEDAQTVQLVHMVETTYGDGQPQLVQPYSSMRPPYPTPHTASSGFSSRFVPLQPPPSATQASFGWAHDDGHSGSASPNGFYGSFGRAQTVALAPPTRSLQPPVDHYARHRSATPTIGSRTSFAHPGPGMTSLPPLRQAYSDYPPTRSGDYPPTRPGLGIFVPTYDGGEAGSYGGPTQHSSYAPTSYDSYAPMPSPIYRPDGRTPSDASFPFQLETHALRGPPTHGSDSGFGLNPRSLVRGDQWPHHPAPPLPSPAYQFGRPSEHTLLAAKPSEPIESTVDATSDVPSQHYAFPAHFRPSSSS